MKKIETKYRFIKTQGVFAPQFSKDDGVTWTFFKESDLNAPFIRGLAKFIARYESRNDEYLRFSNTKELFFVDEIQVSCFLTAVKISWEDKIVEFDSMNFEK